MAEKAWTHQKNLIADPHQPTVQDMIRLARNIPSYRNRALFSLAYLSAGRISELLGKFQKRKDIDPKVWIPLAKKHIYLNKVKNKECLIIELPNLKNRRKKNKTIPIPLTSEPEFIGMIVEFLNEIEDVHEPLFNFTRQMAYKIIKTETGINPHYIRHIRLTHLTVNNDFNESRLQIMAGWSDSRPAKHYVHLKYTDLVDKL